MIHSTDAEIKSIMNYGKSTWYRWYTSSGKNMYQVSDDYFK